LLQSFEVYFLGNAGDRIALDEHAHAFLELFVVAIEYSDVSDVCCGVHCVAPFAWLMPQGFFAIEIGSVGRFPGTLRASSAGDPDWM